MTNIATIKPRFGGLNVHEKPNGRIIDALAPGGCVIFLTGEEEQHPVALWAEVFYHDKAGNYVKGWVDKRRLDVHPDVVPVPINVPRDTHIPLPLPEPKFRGLWDAILGIFVPVLLAALVIWLVASAFGAHAELNQSMMTGDAWGQDWGPAADKNCPDDPAHESPLAREQMHRPVPPDGRKGALGQEYYGNTHMGSYANLAQCQWFAEQQNKHGQMLNRCWPYWHGQRNDLSGNRWHCSTSVD